MQSVQVVPASVESNETSNIPLSAFSKRRTAAQLMESRRAISDFERSSVKSLRASVALIDAVQGHPKRVPFPRAGAITARMRSRRTSRSNSAKTDRAIEHGCAH